MEENIKNHRKFVFQNIKNPFDREQNIKNNKLALD